MITKENDNRIRVSLPKKKGLDVSEIKKNAEAVAIFRGLTGKTGVGIKAIEQRSEDSLVIIFTNGLKKSVKIPKAIPGKAGDRGQPGPPGKDGRGIESIIQEEDNVARVNYTDDTYDILILPRGQDGREIELGYSQTHLQWRYVGDADWKNLFPIPKEGAPGSEGAGSLKVVQRINGLYGDVKLIAGAGIILEKNGNNITLSSPGASLELMGTLWIKTPINETIVIVSSSRYPFSVNGINNLFVSSGSIKISIKINGVDIDGLSGITVTTTPQNILATDNNIVSLNDRVTVVLSDNSSSAGLEFTMDMEKVI